VVCIAELVVVGVLPSYGMIVCTVVCPHFSRFHRLERPELLSTPLARRPRWSCPFSTRHDRLYSHVRLIFVIQVLRELPRAILDHRSSPLYRPRKHDDLYCLAHWARRYVPFVPLVELSCVCHIDMSNTRASYIYIYPCCSGATE